MKLFFSFLIIALMLAFQAPAFSNTPQEKPNMLTFGNVQMTLKKNVTTQYDVLTNFGPPNISTIDGDGNEIWTYQKHSSTIKGKSTTGYGTLILAGVAKETVGLEESQRTMMLLIKFNKNKIVEDFSSMASSF